MKKMQLAARWVLVTGASSGLGEEMARQLAQEYRANLILVARRADRLQALASRLESSAGIKCRVIAADLSVPADVERVYAEAMAVGSVQAVILNAGITHFGAHLEMPWTQFQTLLATNVTSVVRLATLFAPPLAALPQKGGIMVVSSMAGLLPVPYQSAYAGSKAFVTNFSLGLGQELRDDGVSVTVFSPGGIDTDMTRNSRLRYFENTVLLQDVVSCAREGLGAMVERRALHVPGALNRTQLFFSRFVPRSTVAQIARSAYRKALAAN
ncbi:MAG: SDR family NAD(P)-dependent oxidoreductase [Moraxellaceae bacterium]|nr:SDR family NAD(P)-dependent oxidoreductase [Moraxellaceae bacterium]